MTSLKKLNTHIENALAELDAAMIESFRLEDAGVDYLTFGKLGRSIGLLREFQEPIFERYPELAPPPPWQDEPIPELTEDEKQQIAQLTETEVATIDAELLSMVTDEFQKVAKIAGSFVTDSPRHHDNIPILFYRDRIIVMAEKGLIEHQGNLKFMRYSEVRLSTPD